MSYEQEMDYQRWCRRLLRLVWVFCAVVLVTEIAIFAIKRFSGGAANTQEYLFVYIIRPGIMYIAVAAVAHLLSNLLLKNRRYELQTVVFLTGVSLCVAMLAWTHNAVPVIDAVFVIPIFLSVAYEKRWAVVFTALLNMALFLVYVFVLPGTYPFGDGQVHNFMNIITAVALLLCSFGIASMLMSRQTALVNSIMEEHLKSKQDSLTKLYNHAAFYEQLDNSIRHYNATGEAFGLIIIDIDNFKRINDQFGHAVGDVVITTLVSAINGHLAEGDEAFRYGGEEFTILTRRQEEDRVKLANDILVSFRETLSDPSWGTPVTASAGICHYSSRRFGAKREFFAAADEALYEAKRSGKNRSVVWSEAMSRRWGAFEVPAEEKKTEAKG